MLKKRRIILWKIGSNTSKGPQRCTVLLDTRTSSRRRLSVSRWKRIAQILEGCQSMLQYCNVVQNCKTGVLQRPWIPHANHKMKADEAHDGSGHGAADTNTENSDAESETPAQNTETEAQKRKQTVVNGDSEHRDEHTN